MQEYTSGKALQAFGIGNITTRLSGSFWVPWGTQLACGTQMCPLTELQWAEALKDIQEWGMETYWWREVQERFRRESCYFQNLCSSGDRLTRACCRAQLPWGCVVTVSRAKGSGEHEGGFHMRWGVLPKHGDGWSEERDTAAFRGGDTKVL